MLRFLTSSPARRRKDEITNSPPALNASPTRKDGEGPQPASVADIFLVEKEDAYPVLFVDPATTLGQFLINETFEIE